MFRASFNSARHPSYWFRTTVIARQEELPAASYARTVTVLLPTSSGTDADHETVPVAVPAPPVDVVHATDATPTLSLAVPLMVSAAAELDTIDEPGETIVMVGGTVSVLETVPVLGLEAPLFVVLVPVPPGLPALVLPDFPVLEVEVLGVPAVFVEPVPELLALVLEVLPLELPPTGAALAGGPYKA